MVLSSLKIIHVKRITDINYLLDTEIDFGYGDLVSVVDEATYVVNGKGSIALQVLDDQISYIKNVWHVQVLKII